MYGDLRIITVHNLFPHHISLNFDDSEAGSFLTIIGSQEISKVKASSGNQNFNRVSQIFLHVEVLQPCFSRGGFFRTHDMFY